MGTWAKIKRSGPLYADNGLIMESKDVFISHASEDNELVRKIYDKFAEEKVSCWLDIADINPNGEFFAEKITQALRETKVFLLILTPNSNQSGHVANEIAMAFDRHLPFVIYNKNVSIQDFSDSMAYFLSTKQFFDATGKDEDDTIAEIVKQVKSRLADITYNFKLESVPCERKQMFGSMPEETVILPAAKPDKETAEAFAKAKKIAIGKKLGLCFAAFAALAGLIAAVCSGPTYRTPNFKVGEIMSFGNYHGKPMLWVYAGHDRSTDLAKFITRSLYAVKPFATAQSGRYQFDSQGVKDTFVSGATVAERQKQFSDKQFKEMYGSSSYLDSTLRIWLNSADTKVDYGNLSPIPANIDSIHDQRYLTPDTIDRLNEVGFLQGFSDDEKAMLVPVKSSFLLTKDNRGQALNANSEEGADEPQQWTYTKYLSDTDYASDANKTFYVRKFQNIAHGYYYYGEVSDLVTIPSLQEIVEFFDNPKLGLQYNVQNDQNVMDITHSWWTRTPCGYANYTVCAVRPSDTGMSALLAEPVQVSSLVPVRPTISVNTNDIKCSGSGLKDDPYVCVLK